MSRASFLRGAAVLLALAVVASGCFAWGYLAHRNRVFPYYLVRNLAVKADFLPPPRLDNALVRRGDDPRAALASLPYVDGTPDPRSERSGVYRHVEDRVFRGWNLFSPLLQPRAFLIGMDGEVAHQWRAGSGTWQHVELLPGGGLLALDKERRLVRLDRDSQVVWTRNGRFHHDLAVDGEGRIYALNRRRQLRPEVHPENQTEVDLVTVLSPDGELIEEISLLDLLQASPYAFLLPELGMREFELAEPVFDVLHTNHVEVFDDSLADRSPLYAAGNLLLSMRTISTILIADPESRTVLWAWGPGNLVFQHHPTLLDDGHLLIFNNGVEDSEALELDPLTNRVVWRYTADDFFSRMRGSVQRLPNGNTLITESDTGYVFEVTPDGERVWAFANPFFTDDGARMAMWRMRRFFSGDRHLPPSVGGERLR